MPSSGERLLAVLNALASPHRLRIVAALHGGGPIFVSQLARDVGISRPLVHLHLQKLQEAGLVTSRHAVSEDGRALNFYEVVAFDVALTPAAIAKAARSLPRDER